MGINTGRMKPMETISRWVNQIRQLAGGGRGHRHGKSAVARATLVLVASLALAAGPGSLAAREPAKPAPGQSSFHLPTVPARHKHVRALLENALSYIAPSNRMIDGPSGYPLEGWNHDPANKVFMRSFTQLTAIGQGMELLANIVAGYADTPYLSRDLALSHLTKLVKSLRQDQHDPQLSAQGLLANFLDVADGKRLGPLTSDADKQQFLDAFGRDKGEAIWQALQVKGWIVHRGDGREASIRRGDRYGSNYFDGPLAPYADKVTRQKVLELLDRRVVLAVFGDNANLTTSVAKTIGSLLHPDIKDKPQVAELRRELEQFLEDQRPGYARLYDPRAGLFYFGWDASKDRLFGWEDLQGKWKTGHMDYLVNEFRAPATFVVVRYGLPEEALANLGFKIKPYRTEDGRDIYSLAPWEGSAFQALGFGLSLAELKSPSWRRLLENVVDIEIDYARRKMLPGFLSESYTGVGTQYTGDVGIPDISVSTRPRLTGAASLYTLGTAYTVAPGKIEQFLAERWPVVSKLLTDHGPWEGYNVSRQEMIQFQTAAHTLSLILGFLGTGSEHMTRYLESRGLGGRPAEIFKPGERVDFLSDQAQVFAWADKDSSIQSTRRDNAFLVKGDRVNEVSIAFVFNRPGGVSLSGGLLTLQYQSADPLESVLIALKPARGASADVSLIPQEIYTRLAATNGRETEIQVPLPATPGLMHVKEVVITSGIGKQGRPLELRITRFGSSPLGDSFPGPGG